MSLTFVVRRSLKTVFQKQGRQLCVSVNLALPVRPISTIEVTKNLTLITKEKQPEGKATDLKLSNVENKPTVVMLSWLMARKRHIYKYADIYLQQGFHVLNVSVSPWQLLWPIKGTQVVAADILKFLDQNTGSPLLLHGFSVGGYVWGEVMVQMAAEKDRYQHVVDRIAGQIWDSVADITEISIGLPIAVFPRNRIMQSTLRHYILYHLRTFDKVATRHYIRASQVFHTNIVKAPAQFLISKSDPIGAESSNMRAKENWANNGITVYWKCWEKSPHVGHFRHYPEEYIQEIYNFLERVNLLNREKLEKQKEKRKVQAKL